MTLEELKTRLTITLLEAAQVVGVSRNSIYTAAQRGEIPTLRIGTRYVVPVAPLLKMLGIESSTEQSPDRGLEQSPDRP